jgi:hypothetical protein
MGWKIKVLYSQTCNQWSPLEQKKNGWVRQMTIYLKLVDMDCQFQSLIIHVLLLSEGNHLDKMAVTL